jgi:hypothetical protein
MVGVTEGALAVGMVLVCFLLFTDILEVIFPSNLTSELTAAAPNGASVLEHPHWRKLLIAKGGLESDLEADQDMAATVLATRNSVRCKRSTAVAWEKGRKDMTLFQHDTLQTLSNASALIEFKAQNQMRLSENTLVIIKQMEQDLFFDDQRTFVLLVEGALRTQLAPNQINAAYLDLETPQATLRMHSMDGMTEARVVAGPNKTSTVSVYKGAVEVATRSERLTVHANQAIRIPLGKPLKDLITLPRSVQQLSPIDMAQLFKKEHSSNIRFSWQRQTNATGYHFMIARDSDFKDIVADKTVPTNHLDRQRLLPGTYYWRVSMLANDIEGYFSKTHRLHVYRQTAPPELLANYPPQKIYYRNVAPTIGFAWRKSTGSPTYYWQMARDRDFINLVEKKALKTNRLNTDKLSKGIYYWRVGVKEAPNQPISFSAVRRLEIIQDLVPPPLQVEIPSTAVHNKVYTIIGRTEPGANVFIGGYEAKITPTGDFKYAVRLNKGKNVIAVAATDAADNVTSKSLMIVCK